MIKKKTISVRLANSKEDIESFRHLSWELHKNSRYRNITYSDEKRDRLMMQAIESPKLNAIFLAEYEAKPIGFLFCAAGEYIVGTGTLLTTVHSFYVGEKHRSTLLGGKAAKKLITALVKWSEDRGCKEIMIHNTSGIDPVRTDNFLRKAKFGIVGANYVLQFKG